MAELPDMKIDLLNMEIFKALTDFIGECVEYLPQDKKDRLEELTKEIDIRKENK